MRIRTARQEPRRGIILIVVLAILTFFAILGVTFVLYSNSEAMASRIAREAENETNPNMEPEALFSMFLNQLIFDVPDDARGVGSALRGHSLMRNMYGLDYDLDFNTGAINTTDGMGNQRNTIPFNGTGRLAYIHPPTGTIFDNQNDRHLINYTYFRTDGALRDPERLGTRNGPTAARGPFLGGWNPSYTYCDLNHIFLAHVDANGKVTTPSFFRKWTHITNTGTLTGFGSPDGTNPNWTNTTNPVLKYLTLRPRPAENPGFPTPGPGGDVKNWTAAPGGNDSIWLDIGAPVMQAPDGRKYKPLFAPLIIDLDGRINLNVHGNILGSANVHRSNHGLGPWEVNLSRVLNADDTNNPVEWQNLFVHSGVPGKYGPDGVPSNSGAAATGSRPPHFYAQLDPDARQEMAPNGQGPSTNAFQLPRDLPPPPPNNPLRTQPFPVFPPAGYGNGATLERTHHPILYNVFRGPQYDPNNDDRVFAASEMEALFRAGGLGSPALTSDLLRLCPQNLGANTAPSKRIRRQVTVLSRDRRAPGMSPFIFNPDASYAVPTNNPEGGPRGNAVVFEAQSNWTPGAPQGSEFRSDWRAVSPTKRRDIGKPFGNPPTNLSPYPHQNPGSVANANIRFDVAGAQAQFQTAQQERQNLANRIYLDLLQVTGTTSPPSNPANPSNAYLVPRRWLAQLAVNIVDYIDEDDISTPFNFYSGADPATPAEAAHTAGQLRYLPRYWVFGTEMPAVVLNEALIQHTTPPMGMPNQIQPAKIWVELHNPRQAPNGAMPANTQQTDAAAVQLKLDAIAGSVKGAMADPAYSVYRIEVSNSLLSPPNVNDNVLGIPNQPVMNRAGFPLLIDFTHNTQQRDGGALPGGPGVAGNPQRPYILPGGYFVVAPKAPVDAPFRDPLAAGTPTPGNTPVMETDQVEYKLPFPAVAGDERTTGLTILLRRLANPHIPWDPNPAVGGAPNPWYNPYITVDYLEHVPLRDVNAGAGNVDSRGKRQPYGSRTKLAALAMPNANSLAADSPVADQSPAPLHNMIHHTFGLQNNPLPHSGVYNWLPHIDREPHSIMELLHVSGYQPHQLTQRFIRGNNNSAAKVLWHAAPWFDQSHRIYRLFELLEARRRVAGAPSGLEEGKININTAEAEVLRALCDAQASNFFNDAQVNAIVARLLAQRTPHGEPRPDDRPFLGLATAPTVTTQTSAPVTAGANGMVALDAIQGTIGGTDWVIKQGMAIEVGTGGTREVVQVKALDPASRQITADFQHDHPPGTPVAAIGLESTWLRSFNGGGRRLFEVSGNHPYKHDNLLHKIANNLTTRSNVFAVWVTVGFFEVTDDTTQPPRLGAEIGRTEGRHVRHRMFAIIDRSVMTQNTGPRPRFNPRSNPALVPYFSILK